MFFELAVSKMLLTDMLAMLKLPSLEPCPSEVPERAHARFGLVG
jgi:hypothetical protein